MAKIQVRQHVEPFTNTVHFNRKDVKIQVKIEFKNERLSISGAVYEPTNYGSWRDVGGGQCYDELLERFSTHKNAVRLVEIWKRWHLNDMRAGCEHQRKEWNPSEDLSIYHFRMNYETLKLKNELKARAEAAAAKDETALMSDREREILAAPYSFEHDLANTHATYYELEKTESKTAGWVYPKDHPRGLLTKPCDTCGYKYGSAWLFEAVPSEILEELKEMK